MSVVCNTVYDLDQADIGGDKRPTEPPPFPPAATATQLMSQDRKSQLPVVHDGNFMTRKCHHKIQATLCAGDFEVFIKKGI